MFDAFLVPENTRVTAKGDGQPLDISAASNPVFLLTLSITDVIEQQSIEVSLFTSADGATWDPKPVATFPQRFYVGSSPLLVDLSAVSTAKFARAHWEVNRWGRGVTTPKFVMGMRIREVAREALSEAQAEAQARR